ncbi:hypothetical protein CCHR01_17133 [Colletotrichum chrysophilum]|uniref:Uncharacterized protein n=1 Tax=Colletotrichum chrysophilum TaxID=1836956 RepID=A0AAD9ECS2_9PEZI|nr:hypothetical protein CCHR01_17133 [Colletotrichum chrysophilum]
MPRGRHALDEVSITDLLTDLVAAVKASRATIMRAFDDLATGFLRSHRKRTARNAQFPLWLVERTESADLQVILAARFGEHWENLPGSDYDRRYRVRAAEDLGLDSYLHLYLWFGEAAVRSRDCWRSMPPGIKALDLFGELLAQRQAAAARRKPPSAPSHHLEDPFLPKEIILRRSKADASNGDEQDSEGIREDEEEPAPVGGDTPLAVSAGKSAAGGKPASSVQKHSAITREPGTPAKKSASPARGDIRPVTGSADEPEVDEETAVPTGNLAASARDPNLSADESEADEDPAASVKEPVASTEEPTAPAEREELPLGAEDDRDRANMDNIEDEEPDQGRGERRSGPEAEERRNATASPMHDSPRAPRHTLLDSREALPPPPLYEDESMFGQGGQSESEDDHAVSESRLEPRGNSDTGDDSNYVPNESGINRRKRSSSDAMRQLEHTRYTLTKALDRVDWAIHHEERLQDVKEDQEAQLTADHHAMIQTRADLHARIDKLMDAPEKQVHIPSSA